MRQTDGQTAGRTDTVPLRTPCSRYCAGGAHNTASGESALCAFKYYQQHKLDRHKHLYWKQNTASGLWQYATDVLLAVHYCLFDLLLIGGYLVAIYSEHHG